MTRLHNAGVNVILSIGDSGSMRNQRFEAGWMIEYGITWSAALATITSNPAAAYGLPLPAGRILTGYQANLVVYNGDPLSLQSHTQLVALATHVQCRPLQP
jgi:imidazolonepropionase-like amidohydrolase